MKTHLVLVQGPGEQPTLVEGKVEEKYLAKAACRQVFHEEQWSDYSGNTLDVKNRYMKRIFQTEDE